MDSVIVRFAGIAKEFTVSSDLDLGFITVKWYGAIIAFGFTLAVLWGGRTATKWKMNLDKMVDVLIYGTITAIIGARLYFVAFKWDYYSEHLADIPKIWEGGLAIYGGIIGGIAAAWVVCKVRKLNFYNLLDMAGMSLLIGQGIGRWGNYANQEAFGSFTGGNWGMMSDKVISYISSTDKIRGMYGLKELQSFDQVKEYVTENNLYVHPTFFYESVWCILGFFVLYIIMKKYRKFSGQLFLTYGVWYGLERTFVEGLRSDSLYININGTNFRVSQVLSMAIVAVCGVILIALLIKFTKHPKPIEGVDYFQPLTEKEILVQKKKEEKKALKKQIKEGASENTAEETADDEYEEEEE